MSKVTDTGIFEDLIERADSEVKGGSKLESIPAIGEYVLATEWPEGDPEDSFAIGFIHSICEEEGYYDISSLPPLGVTDKYDYGTYFYGSSVRFRKAEKVSKEEGLLMISLIVERKGYLGIPVWDYYERVKDRAHGKDCEKGEFLQQDLNYREGFNEGFGCGYAKGKLAGWVSGFREGMPQPIERPEIPN